MNRTLFYSLLVFLAGSSYGLIVPVIKDSVEAGIYPSTFVPLQYLVAFVVCLVVKFVRRIKWCSPKRLFSLALLGAFASATSLCYYTSVSSLPSSAALTLLFQYIWISVLIECVHKKQRPSTSTIMAIVIVLIGTLFATGLIDGGVDQLDFIGVVAGLGSALFYALFLYYSGMIGTTESTVLRTTMLAAGGLVVSSIVSPACYVTALPDPATWPYAIGLAVLGILVPTSLINFASPKLTTGMVSIMASSELPVGVLAAWAFASDAPTPLVLFGASLVFAGIVVKQVPALVQRRRSRA